ncbi:MAG: hypothetical protein O2897_00915 [bacterium]|nr:hypothetical protein [bacterium]
MDENEIIATFDTEETARMVAKSLNNWFSWIMENDNEEDIPDFFEDFGISADEYALDKESDVDWDETPVARARGNRVVITVASPTTIATLEELLEGLGAYDVTLSDDED